MAAYGSESSRSGNAPHREAYADVFVVAVVVPVISLVALVFLATLFGAF